MAPNEQTEALLIGDEILHEACDRVLNWCDLAQQDLQQSETQLRLAGLIDRCDSSYVTSPLCQREQQDAATQRLQSVFASIDALEKYVLGVRQSVSVFERQLDRAERKLNAKQGPGWNKAICMLRNMGKPSSAAAGQNKNNNEPLRSMNFGWRLPACPEFGIEATSTFIEPHAHASTADKDNTEEADTHTQ